MRTGGGSSEVNQATKSVHKLLIETPTTQHTSQDEDDPLEKARKQCFIGAQAFFLQQMGPGADVNLWATLPEETRETYANMALSARLEAANLLRQQAAPAPQADHQDTGNGLIQTVARL